MLFRSKDDFLAAVSHELRSPLNPVLLLASEYARSSELPQRLREDFQIILHNVRLQARLIDDLLDLNRIQRGGLSISARRLHLKTVLEEVCKVQLLAMQAGRPMKKVQQPTIDEVRRVFESGDLYVEKHFAGIKRRLDVLEPDYKN